MRYSSKQALVGILIAAFACATASTALADPRYEVMNAPEGVYWRSEPNWAAAERTTGFGVYNGTIIEVHCYQSGTAVEGSADTMWEQATDVGGRGYGSGWVNEHFINDGQPINQPSPGVSPCNAPPPPPPPPPPGLVFPIFNAEDGIYYRYGPHWNETTATPGVGVYNGDQVQLICGAFGDPVGPFNDTAWSKVRNLTRPSIGEGWVNEHFINDRALTNQFVGGETMCDPGTGGGSSTGGSGSGGGGASPSQLPGGASIYYSPFDGNKITWHHGLSSATVVPAASVIMDKSQWESTSCKASLAVPPTSYGGQTGIYGDRITMLSGWSYGRNGPIMLLAAHPAWISQINYILLIDPGSLSDYETGACDQAYPNKSALIANWLASNSANRLVILAGKDTADYSHPYQGRGHGGIQRGLFATIKAHPMVGNRDLRKQVAVCNYDTMIHHVIWQKFAYETGKPTPITVKTCPLARGFPNPLGWSP